MLHHRFSNATQMWKWKSDQQEMVKEETTNGIRQSVRNTSARTFIRHYLWFSVGREPVTNWWLHTWRRNQIIFITLRSPCSDRLAAFYLAKLNIKGSGTVCLAPCYASLLIYVAHFCSGLLKLSLFLLHTVRRAPCCWLLTMPCVLRKSLRPALWSGHIFLYIWT